MRRRAMNKRVMLVVIAMLLVKNVDAAATAEHSYLVRKQLFVQPNASAPAPVSDFVATLGGTVQMELPRWFVVTLPEAAVAALKAHPAVRYLQQVISGPVPSVVTAAAMHQSVPQRSVIETSGPDSGTYAYD